MSAKAVLEVKGLSFSYSQDLVLKEIDFSVGESETIALVGPSGFGKSTLLQLIAGDLKPQSGAVKRCGLWRRVFQNEALLPWFTVQENIHVGLRGVPPGRALDFDHLVEILDLKRVLPLYPRQLSGGLRQRAEIARALIGRPDALLLDEPFNALDYLIRCETRDYLLQLLREYPMAMILVTHDIPEAVALTRKTLLLSGHPARIQDSVIHKEQSSEELVCLIQDKLRKFKNEN